MLQTLELFGGIGSPRIALRDMGIPVKAIDYVEIDEQAVRSYNAMFAEELDYKTQSVVNWNLKPDVLIHGSPCQDVSIAGKQQGAEEGSETRSSLMWETIKIIQNMGSWKPRVVIWENVKSVRFKSMIKNFNRYLSELEKLGYVNSHNLLNAMDYGLPQNRDRVFVVSILKGGSFNFNLLRKRKPLHLNNYLLENKNVLSNYDVTQPSVLSCIGKKGIRRATVLKDFAYTITTRQDRTPAQIIDCENGRFRYLTELECWRLQGYSDNDYYAAEKQYERNGRFFMPLYRQAGNSIPTVFFEAIFEALL